MKQNVVVLPWGDVDASRKPFGEHPGRELQMCMRKQLYSEF